MATAGALRYVAMRGMFVVASLLSALGGSAAQQPAPVPAGTASIAGRIFDDTNRPLADVIMTLTMINGSGVLTLQQGGELRGINIRLLASDLLRLAGYVIARRKRGPDRS